MTKAQSRPRWVSLILVLVVGGCSHSGHRPGSGDDGTPPGNFPEAAQGTVDPNVVQPSLDALVGEQWWGLYANSTRVGKAHLLGKRSNTPEGEGIALVFETSLEVPPPPLRANWEQSFVKNGKPLKLHQRLREEGELGATGRSTSIEVAGEQVRRTSGDAGETAGSEVRYPLPTDRAFLLSGLHGAEFLMVAASVDPTPGKVYEYDVAAAAGPRLFTVTVEEAERLEIRGKEYDSMRLRMEEGKTVRRVWISGDRRVLKWGEVGPDGNLGVTAVVGSAEEAESDLGTAEGVPGPHEAVLGFIKGLNAEKREMMDLVCDYDGVYAQFVQDGRGAGVSRSAFAIWFRNRLAKDPNLTMSQRSIDLLRQMLKTVIRGDRAQVSFTDPGSGQDYFRFTLKLGGQGWMIINYEP